MALGSRIGGAVLGSTLMTEGPKGLCVMGLILGLSLLPLRRQIKRPTTTDWTVAVIHGCDIHDYAYKIFAGDVYKVSWGCPAFHSFSRHFSVTYSWSSDLFGRNYLGETKYSCRELSPVWTVCRFGKSAEEGSHPQFETSMTHRFILQ